MALITRNGKAGFIRIVSLAVFFFIFSFSVFGQTTCTVSNTTPTVHAEGLAELVGNITFQCTGGAGTITTLLVLTVNANVTNRLDVNGNLTGVTVSGSGATFGEPPALNSSPHTVVFSSLQFTAGTPAIFTISGLRVAVPTASGGGATPTITGSVTAQQLNIPNPSLFLAVSQPTLLSSVLNYGIPCTGSPATPLPATIDFPGLVAAGTASSTIRVTEASLNAFAPLSPGSGADFGVRFLVSISGYGPNAQVFVPDVIVGNLPPTPTSAGAFNTLATGGSYTPNTNQLLLTRVNGADATGNGGTRFLTPAPSGPQSFTSVSQLNLVNGAATVTYEVLAANPSLIDSAQIPVFVVVPPASTCPDSLANSLGATLAPASNVTTATVTDPIPRYIPTTPASDCTVIQDCSASYFPVLAIGQTAPPIILNGSSQGKTQKAVITVNNTGGSQMTFNISTTYQPAAGQSVANWLSISATTGVVEGSTFVPVTFTADPSALLVQGAYQATVTVNAGSAGTVVLPVTFNVGPPGPAIQGVVNAANFQAGAAITSGSFAAIFGLNLAPKTTVPACSVSAPANCPTVTFNGANATVVYDSATQINVLLPASLGSATTAAVVATIDGVATNTFTVNLVANAPAVFNPGILNQNNSVNSATALATFGDEIQIFLTGLSTTSTLPVTVTIGSVSLSGAQIIYAGAVPSIPGLEQVNVLVPAALTFTGNSAPLSICVPASSGTPVCSVPVPLYVH